MSLAWVGLGAAVAEWEVACSVRAGCGGLCGKSLQCVMGKRLNRARGQMLKGSWLREGEARGALAGFLQSNERKKGCSSSAYRSLARKVQGWWGS